MKNLFFFLSIALFCFSCKHEPEITPVSDDSFVFTTYYCECGGSCISGYKLTSKGLFKGAGEWCLPETLVFEENALSADKKILAETLRAAIPATLLLSNEEIYGCPDCGDWGGHYVELTTDGTTRVWRLDNAKQNLSGDVKTFAEKVEQTLHELE